MSYMGQELALEHKPNIFEKDPIELELGDKEFERYFIASLQATKEAKEEAPFFSWTIGQDCRLKDGASREEVIYCLRSVEPAKMPYPIDISMIRKGNYLLVIQPELDSPASQRSYGSASKKTSSSLESMPCALFDIEGTDLLSRKEVRIAEGDRLPRIPASLIRLED
ncbi:MAG: hypothetical protein BWX81_01303 [Spirochaetes bacterium ADurb.Bin110]|nr:MAG: hypothetical protein BWX81_01303 [Spirochaetes bacterium ADurb.Bin110]